MPPVVAGCNKACPPVRQALPLSIFAEWDGVEQLEPHALLAFWGGYGAYA